MTHVCRAAGGGDTMRAFPILQEALLTRTQRWAGYLAILTAVVGLSAGFLIKDLILSSATVYRDLAAGILAQYPTNWLLDTEGDYVFRVRDPTAPTFRTTLQVAVEPIGADATARNVLDNLTLARAQTLAAYRVLSTVETTLPEGEAATRLDYVYVETEANPFLESLPVVVRGVDVVTIKGGQAIIVTFRADRDVFDAEVGRLSQFLAALEF